MQNIRKINEVVLPMNAEAKHPHEVQVIPLRRKVKEFIFAEKSFEPHIKQNIKAVITIDTAP